MEKKNGLANRIEKGIAKAKMEDLLLKIFSNFTNLATLGTPFGSLINSFIPSRRLARLEEFIIEVAKKLEELEDKIDLEYLNTDEFAYLFENCIKSAADFYQEEKLEAYKAILVNSTLPGSIKQSDKEFYLNLTDQLTSIHFIILGFCSDTHGYLDSIGISPSQVTGNLKSSLKIIFQDYDFGIVQMALSDLHRNGLITIDGGSLGGITSNQGMQIVGEKRLTESGSRYLSFIKI